jgi:hypothetical protein
LVNRLRGETSIPGVSPPKPAGRGAVAEIPPFPGVDARLHITPGGIMTESYWVEGEKGAVLDARALVDGRSVSLLARAGPSHGRPPENTEHGAALEAICRRATRDGNLIERILIDSSEARKLPETERILLTGAEIEALDLGELVAAVRLRLRKFGQAAGTKGGNATKRVRFDLQRGKPVQLLKLRVDAPPASTEPAGAIGPSEEDRWFAEGAPRRAEHLRRERDPALAALKREQFLEYHDHFHCEDCGEDWIAEYGPEVAAGCFEVHHAATKVSDMGEGHLSRIEDLRLLCANCHRAEHRRMKLAGDARRQAIG